MTTENLLNNCQDYKELFENALDMIYILDSKEYIVNVNKMELKILGYKKTELIGKHVLDIIHTDYKETTREKLKQVLIGKSVYKYKTKFVTKNREKISVEVNAIPKKKAGKLTGAIAIIRDVTQSEILSQFPSENPYPVIRIDKNSKILFINKPASRLLFDLEKIKNKSIPKDWKNIINGVFEKKTVYKEGFDSEHKNQIFIWTFVPIENRYMNIYGREITKRKEVEEYLKAKIEELEKINKVMVNRELKMIELKEQIKKLKQKS